jgi:hypothetical protein
VRVLTQWMVAAAAHSESNTNTNTNTNTNAAGSQPAAPPRVAAPEWAEPDVLWKLSGEVLADRKELMLPRSWLQSTVPWNDVAAHLRQCMHWLESCSSVPVGEEPAVSGTATSEGSAPPAAKLGKTTPAPHGLLDKRQHWLREDSASFEAGAGGDKSVNPAGMRDGERGATAGLNDEDCAMELSVQSAVEATVSELQAYMLPSTAGHPEPSSAPKVLIAEVRSHNDPAFVDVLRRQLAAARSEKQVAVMCAIRVVEELPQAANSQPSRGVATWQQALVDRLAAHPVVQQPYAFLSSAGELLLTVRDIDRGEVTNLIREAMEELLAVKPRSANSARSFPGSPTPLRHYAGIAAVDSPAAGFAAEQLVAAAFRCLEAAQRQSKAAIKSIEVF